MTAAEKLPLPDRDLILAHGPEWAADHPAAKDLVSEGATWWRVYRVDGPFPVAWDEFRHDGPFSDFRFEPHPSGPPTNHPGHGILYAGADVPTCLAEVFWTTRRVVTRGRELAAWELARDARLLDLTNGWPLRVGGAHSINATDDKKRTSAWAAVLRELFPDADGLLYQSSLSGRHALALFDPPAAGLLPDEPSFTIGLGAPAFSDRLLSAAAEIGFSVLPNG